MSEARRSHLDYAQLLVEYFHSGTGVDTARDLKPASEPLPMRPELLNRHTIVKGDIPVNYRLNCF